MVFENCDIAGVTLPNGLVCCRACLGGLDEDDRGQELTQGQVITREALLEEELVCFCDYCERRI